jgi:hypothetical protein
MIERNSAWMNVFGSEWIEMFVNQWASGEIGLATAKSKHKYSIVPMMRDLIVSGLERRIHSGRIPFEQQPLPPRCALKAEPSPPI